MNEAKLSAKQVVLENRRGITTTFWAEEVEELPHGYLRAVGSFGHWDEDAEGRVTHQRGRRQELCWPPARIKEVRGE